MPRPSLRIAVLFASPLLFLLGGSPAAEVAQQPDPAPKGEVTKYGFKSSKIFPGTEREYWVYVPKQYDPAKPACVHVNQDGIQFNAPAVFDELIHKKEMPVTIGVFIMPGRVKAPHEKALDRFNRSYEYDGLGDNYVRFLLDELLPDVETKKTSEGRPINLSKSGNDRSIGGSSSGAICAFTAAWERPDAFSRVFSAIGTYVGLRGGNNYPTLIRKYEPKPIRIFLQDGSGDLDIYGGDWWMANQEMQRALKFAGYEVNHEWGTGGHDNKHATTIFPEAMKWLWKDWPAPVKAGAGSKEMKEVLIAGEAWNVVEGKHAFAHTPFSNAKGEVYFNQKPIVIQTEFTHKIGLDRKVSLFNSDMEKGEFLAIGPDGSFYSVSNYKVLAHGPDGKSKEVADAVMGLQLVVCNDGKAFLTFANMVYSLTSKNPDYIVDRGTGGIAHIPMPLHAEKPERYVQYAEALKQAYPIGGVAVSPDQTLLYVADSRSHWVYSFQIQPDATLKQKQRFYHLHVSDGTDDCGAAGMSVDRDGRLYVATRTGIQVCDQMGRVNCIIPVPSGQPTGICFGGANFDTLFVTCGDKIYSRKLKTRGANAFEPPIKPAPPRL